MKSAGSKVLCFDLDGVIYYGNTPAKDAIRTLQTLKEAGILFCFVTNNSGKTRKDIHTKLARMNIDCDLEQIYTASYATAKYLEKYARGKKICVVGSSGLKEELSGANLSFSDDPKCDILVVGYKHDFCYSDICLGLDALIGGAEFIACNIVPNYPIENGRLMPGSGAMVGAIEASSGRKPDYITGKPNTLLLELVAKDYEADPENLVIIGDSIEEDVKMAKDYGSFSVLISPKSREHTKADGPDVSVKKIDDILDLVKKGESRK